MKAFRLILFALLLAPCAFAAGDLSGAHDFDFEFGDWSVHHRVKAATGEWYEFEGTANARPILGGLGNVEDCLFHRPGGDSKGRFAKGLGTFYSDGEWNGKPVRTRYTWSAITAGAARWEQAFSYDAGKTWETNWVMEFRRVK
jgi:hypothetical protein